MSIRPRIKRGRTPIVYFIQAGPFIKIGFSTVESFSMRLVALRDGCPYVEEAVAPYLEEQQRRFDMCFGCTGAVDQRRHHRMLL